jgi:phosphoglucosamine mutase
VATAPERLDGLSIVLDCGHGAGSTTSARAIRELGARVEEIHCDWNGTDINLGCGSTHLEVLAQAVRSAGADLGIAHDGDADRTLAVDETGAEVDGDEIMAICARMMREAGTLTGDVVVGTVMTNLGFIVAMREMGVDVHTTPVGDRYVLEEMRRSGAALGGEQSGHIIFLKHTTTGDGLVTAIQLLGAVKSAGRPLSELKRVMRRYPQVLENVRVADLSGLPRNTAVAEAIEAEQAALGERGRVLVRASGTEPVVRVMAEASESQTAQAVVTRLVQVVRTQLG